MKSFLTFLVFSILLLLCYREKQYINSVKKGIHVKPAYESVIFPDKNLKSLKEISHFSRTVSIPDTLATMSKGFTKTKFTVGFRN